MTRLVKVAALVCLLFAGAVVCGCGGEEASAHPRRELLKWYAGVEDSVAAMERKQRDFTQFGVKEPPERSRLMPLSPAGARAGEAGSAAAARLDEATTLTSREAAGLYCYFFAFYVDLESSPDKEEFEAVIINLVKKSLSPSASPRQVRASAAELREAMIAAEKAGELGPQVAAAMFC